MREEEVAPEVGGDPGDCRRGELPPPGHDDTQQRGGEEVEPAHERGAEGRLLQVRQGHAGRVGERNVLERVRRLLHARRSPDEDDVQCCQGDEADADRPHRRDQRGGGGGGEARHGDQHEARGVPHEAVRQPGCEPEPRGDRRPEPPAGAAAEESVGCGERRRPERREAGEPMRPLRHEVDDEHTGPQERRRHGEQGPAPSTGACLACGRRGRRGLRGAENGVGGD